MRTLWAIMTWLPLALTGCTSDEAPKPDEPIASSPEDQAQATPDEAPASTSAGQEGASDGAPPASDTETIGELTDSSTPADPTLPKDAEVPPESGFSDAPQGDEVAAAMTSAETVTRYINTTKLNVRSAPSRKASVVRQLTKGTAVQAVIEGKYAKIGEGEYVLSKYLSTKSGKAKGKDKVKKAKSKAKGKTKAKKKKPK